MKNITISSTLLISLLLGIPVVCSASYLGPAEMYNAYAISSFNYGSTDIQGIIGSGGDINYDGGDVGSTADPVTNPYSIYSGGNVTLTGHAVKNGGIQADGAVTTTDTSIAGDINSGSSVTITRGSMASGATIDNDGDLTTNNFQVQGTVTSQGSVSITSGSTLGPINATGNVTTSKAGLGGDITSEGQIEIKEGSMASPLNFTSNGDFKANNNLIKGHVHTGGTFTGKSGSIVGTVEAVGGRGPGNTYYIAPANMVEGAAATAPNVSIAAHQSDAIDHGAIADAILNASSTFASMPANGTVSEPYSNQWLFSGSSDLNIFDIDGSTLGFFDSLTFDGLAGAAFVLNVAGTEINYGLGKAGGFHFLNDLFEFDPSKILFNFFEAEILNIHGSLHGTVLAPLADVTTDGSGTIFGSLYADNISGTSQINSIYFDGSSPEIGEIAQVPAAATLSLFGIGLLALLRRNRKNLAATKS